MEKEAKKFLSQLCNSFAPSGFEREAIRLTKEYIEPFADEIKFDKLGSMMFLKKGASQRPVILLPGHIDEVGFIISGINEKGFLTFNPIGGWFDQVLLGQRVRIRTRAGKDIEGVIAAKPPHLLTPEERNKVVEMSKMFIDVGCSNKKEVEELGIRIGDPVVPISSFSVFKRKKYTSDGKPAGTMEMAMSKAFDDRIGVYMAAEVVRRLRQQQIAHPNTVVGATTAQEEVGIRGARTTAWVVEPDVSLILDVDISGDIPGIEPSQAPAVMGKGPTILTFDSTHIPNQSLKEFVIDIAEKNNIPYQLSQIGRGGTDAAVIHLSRAGCPSLVIGIATRHIHSHVSILSLQDVENGIKLLIEVIKKLDQDTVTAFTEV